jgi:ribosomal protein S18 acetylase RimI-like enzyme
MYEQAGLRPLRWFADLTCRLADPPPELVVPEGIRIVPMREDHLEAVRLAHNESFEGRWGMQPLDEAHWLEELNRSTARLEWSWVAIDNASSEIVGYITNAAYEQDWEAQGYADGWTDRLGVRKPWRRRGIARALLTATMRSYAYAGLDAAGLGVDTEQPTGAYGLYAEMGFVATNTTVLYARTEDRAEVEASLQQRSPN